MGSGLTNTVLPLDLSFLGFSALGIPLAGTWQAGQGPPANGPWALRPGNRAFPPGRYTPTSGPEQFSGSGLSSSDTSGSFS